MKYFDIISGSIYRLKARNQREGVRTLPAVPETLGLSVDTPVFSLNWETPKKVLKPGKMEQLKISQHR